MGANVLFDDHARTKADVIVELQDVNQGDGGPPCEGREGRSSMTVVLFSGHGHEEVG
ncbi:hypothetical protein [Alicyclobacillus fodiniaquatilis]|uniref:Uncharacterized protein n=1 Tax=Alicyclobacillus fodiniaquatilis TaxID=1661150 RepID=A0ABW4JF14_9BACL